jgi:hypothetical protein
MISEHVEQREFVSWFRQTYRPVRIFAIPNGGARSLVTAARLKVEGVSAGVPDLYIPAWRVWIEIKTEVGRLSPAQQDWIEYLQSIDDTVIVARGKEDAVYQIKNYFINMMKGK